MPLAFAGSRSGTDGRPWSPSRSWLALASVTVGTILLVAGSAAASPQIRQRLNQTIQRVTEANRSWRPLMDALLAVSPPTKAIGPDFNQNSIWPGMPGWPEVSAWAAANEALGPALIGVADRVILGLPYGKDAVDRRYADAGLYAEIQIGEDARTIDFAYLRGIDLMATWVAAEMYRLGEAGRFDDAFALGIANAKILRKIADRQMLAEKAFAMTRLVAAMRIQREFMWTYRERIPAATFQRLGVREYPFLRPTDNERLRRLEMPEGDRIVAEAILEMGFDANGQPDPDRFEEIFAEIQSANRPLTRFGAAKRWRAISNVHGSLEASRGKLSNIYDDWWRRWRMRPYDAMQELTPELDRTNEIRYAGVLVTILDIQSLFELRRLLNAEINGTILAAGICGYRNAFGVWPDLPAKYYAVYAPKRFDFDPYDRAYGSFRFRFLGTQRQAIDTPYGRLTVTGCLLWARGENHDDGNAALYDPEGRSGDLVLWPPLRALARQEGLLD